MPQALRFVTARDLFEAYPIALDELCVEATDQPSLEFLRSLVDSNALGKAIGFCAFLLPRRQAVWWAGHCVRMMIAERTPEEDAGLQAAEAWLKEPEEDRRLASLEFGRQADQRLPTTWVALAAGWAGPTMPTDGEDSMTVPPYQTARAARAAVLIAGSRVPVKQRDEMLRRCAESGAKLAVGENPAV